MNNAIIEKIWSHFKTANQNSRFPSHGTLGWNNIYKFGRGYVVRGDDGAYEYFDTQGDFLKTMPSSYVSFDYFPVTPVAKFDLKTGKGEVLESKLKRTTQLKLESLIRKLIREESNGPSSVIKKGGKYELDLEGYGSAMFGMNRTEFAELKKHDGQKCVVLNCVPSEDSEEDFCDLKFNDGYVIKGVSSWNLKPIGWSANK